MCLCQKLSVWDLLKRYRSNMQFNLGDTQCLVCIENNDNIIYIHALITDMILTKCIFSFTVKIKKLIKLGIIW